MTDFEHVYWIIAIASSTILAVQLFIAFLTGVDVHMGSDMHPGGDLSNHELNVPHFQLLTIRNIVAFFVLLGWSGIAFYHNHMPLALVIIFSIICGTAMMLTTAGMFYALSKLQSSGNVDISSAKENNATVYLPIPPSRQGTGKIEVILQGKKIELDALSDDPQKIPTGATVKIREVSNNQAVVERV